MHQTFCEAIKEVKGSDAQYYIDLWRELPMNQIELPGDVWNNFDVFKNNLILKVISLDKEDKGRGTQDIVREIYTRLKGEELQFRHELMMTQGSPQEFYPERFDVTFDFAPRMCKRGLCRICLFGPNGVDKLCNPKNGKDRYCPVALTSCGYTKPCVGEGEECIMRDNIGKNLCKPLAAN